MARKHYVLCYECGKEFDANEPGTQYIKKSRRYVCPLCARKKLAAQQPSPTSYKVGGYIACVAGVIICPLGLLLALALPAVGIAFAAGGVGFFLLGKKFIKTSKVLAERKKKILEG